VQVPLEFYVWQGVSRFVGVNLTENPRKAREKEKR
jgi:hypothetical protein